jgi:hypothetical protein
MLFSESVSADLRLNQPIVRLVVCCARAANGHAAAPPPSSVMNSRRFMGRPSSGLAPHLTTPLRDKAAVHYSKNCALMSQMGQKRKRSD